MSWRTPSGFAGQRPGGELHRACGIDAPGVFSDDEQAMVESGWHLAALGTARSATWAPGGAVQRCDPAAWDAPGRRAGRP